MDQDYIFDVILFFFLATLSIITHVLKTRFKNLVLYVMPIQQAMTVVTFFQEKASFEEKEVDHLSILSAKLIPIELHLCVLLFMCVFFSPSFKYSSLVYCPFYLLSSVGMHLTFINTVAKALNSNEEVPLTTFDGESPLATISEDVQPTLDTLEILKVIFSKSV